MAKLLDIHLLDELRKPGTRHLWVNFLYRSFRDSFHIMHPRYGPNGRIYFCEMNNNSISAYVKKCIAIGRILKGSSLNLSRSFVRGEDHSARRRFRFYESEGCGIGTFTKQSLP